LKLARSGADLNRRREFSRPDWIRQRPADGKNIKCKVLALAGADDPFQKRTI